MIGMGLFKSPNGLTEKLKSFSFFTLCPWKGLIPLKPLKFLNGLILPLYLFLCVAFAVKKMLNDKFRVVNHTLDLLPPQKPINHHRHHTEHNRKRLCIFPLLKV